MNSNWFLFFTFSVCLFHHRNLKETKSNEVTLLCDNLFKTKVLTIEKTPHSLSSLLFLDKICLYFPRRYLNHCPLEIVMFWNVKHCWGVIKYKNKCWSQTRFKKFWSVCSQDNLEFLPRLK